MVLSVDDWIETKDGDIGLVVNTDKVKRAGGEVAVYFPATVDLVDVPVGCVRGKFLRVLARRASV